MDSSDLVLIVDQGHLLIAYFRAPLSAIFNVVGKQPKSTHDSLKIKSVRFLAGFRGMVKECLRYAEADFYNSLYFINTARYWLSARYQFYTNPKHHLFSFSCIWEISIQKLASLIYINFGVLTTS